MPGFLKKNGFSNGVQIDIATHLLQLMPLINMEVCWSIHGLPSMWLWTHRDVVAWLRTYGPRDANAALYVLPTSLNNNKVPLNLMPNWSCKLMMEIKQTSFRYWLGIGTHYHRSRSIIKWNLLKYRGAEGTPQACFAIRWDQGQSVT